MKKVYKYIFTDKDNGYGIIITKTSFTCEIKLTQNKINQYIKTSIPQAIRFGSRFYHLVDGAVKNQVIINKLDYNLLASQADDCFENITGTY